MIDTQPGSPCPLCGETIAQDHKCSEAAQEAALSNLSQLAATLGQQQDEPPAMKHNQEPEIVIFRRDPDGGVYALFPEVPGNCNGMLCSCYDPTGGHTAADYQHCVATSKPAKPAEYASVQQELTNHYGYVLKIRRRAPGDSYQKRRAEIQEVERRYAAQQERSATQ